MKRLRLLSCCLLLSLAGCIEEDLSKLTARLEVTPAQLDFGAHPVLDTPSLPLRLENKGRAPLKWRLRIDGQVAFTAATSEGRLAGLESVDVGIVFAPKEQRAYAATAVVSSDDGTGKVFEIPLTGRGERAAAVDIKPLSVDFGRVNEGGSAVRTVTVRSVGNAPLRITGLSIQPIPSGDNILGGPFSFVGSTRTPVELAQRLEGADDATATLTLRYAPVTGKDPTAATLVVATNDPEHLTVSIPLSASINRRPLARPVADRPLVEPGLTVRLDGAFSVDPDGDNPLQYQWVLLAAPAGSTALIDGDRSVGATLLPDRPGGYVVQLVVTDATGLESLPQTVPVTVMAGEKLQWELVWDHPLADLDLHVLRAEDMLDGGGDCFWDQRTPDWGVVGDASDDPRHHGDKLSGFGPERVTYVAPPDDDYRVVVRYKSAQGAAVDARKVQATVRVRLYGVVARELVQTLSVPGEVWEAGWVTWPGGAVQPWTGEGER